MCYLSMLCLLCSELEPVDHLLIGCPRLTGAWGRERFGLAAVPVLQAIEVRRIMRIMLPYPALYCIVLQQEQ